MDVDDIAERLHDTFKVELKYCMCTNNFLFSCVAVECKILWGKPDQVD